MNTAQKVISTPDRTPRERHDMAAFLCTRWQDAGRDMTQYFFSDGSSILMQLDEDLRPCEMVEI